MPITVELALCQIPVTIDLAEQEQELDTTAKAQAAGTVAVEADRLALEKEAADTSVGVVGRLAVEAVDMKVAVIELAPMNYLK